MQPQQLAWHPWSGCSPISPSCLNCYAVPEASDLVTQTKRGPVFNGQLRWNRDQFMLPMNTPTPSYITVCPHGDLFHENAPLEWVDNVFNVMHVETRHIYMVLTKRADRMLEFLSRRYGGRNAPPHIAVGVSCERQLEANQRITALLDAPAESKWLTFYALLEPVDILAIPNITVERLASIKQVVIGDAWLTANVSREWYDDIGTAFRALEVPVTEHDLSKEVAARGW